MSKICSETKADLINEIAKCRAEKKALEKELETFKETFYLLEETSTEVEDKRDEEC